MSNYSATVVRIQNLRPIAKADRLLATTIFGNNVIVGIDTKIGDLGLFFPLESQIGLEYAEANDLLRRTDENGKPAGGMFSDNRRVRAQTFRGEKSMGFFIPIESLDVLSKTIPFVIDSSDYKEGSELESIEGVLISQKYIPRTNATNKGGGSKKGRQAPRESKIIQGQFAFHSDTAQLGKNLHKINPSDQIVITYKLHGTSAIAGNVLVKRKLNLIEKLLKRFGVSVVDTQYEMVYASRRVIKNEFHESKQHFYKYDLWSEVGKKHFEGKLHTGETVYYEIVGYLNDGGFIQKDYDYNCEPGTNDVYVYRITQTAADGTVVELQWNQLRERCTEIGVKFVREIFYGDANGWTDDKEVCVPHGYTTDKWRELFLSDLQKNCVYDQDSIFCQNKVPEEGIVLRKEGLQIEAFKLKSFRFFEHETKQLDKGETNVEDVDDGDEDIRI